MMALRAAIVAMALLVAGQSYAWEPDEVLADPVLEARARDISAQLRCLVCQNESIDASDADLAKDLRLLVRDRLTAGDSDDQVFTFLVDRYGEFILLKPKFRLGTALLWGLPALMLIIGSAFIVLTARKPNVHPAEFELSNRDKERLAKIIDEK
jgi:cytochrome c-type biogenesis protein CcmH